MPSDGDDPMTALLLKIIFPLALAGLAVWWWANMMLTYAHQLGMLH